MNKTSNWHGPKQIKVMIFTAIAMLIGACLSGGSTNTILPVIAEKYAWDVQILRTWAGIGTCLVVVGSFCFTRLIIKKGSKLAMNISLLITAVFCVIYGWTGTYPLFICSILVISIMAGGYYQAGVANLTANWWPTKKGVVLGITTMAIPLMDIVWQPFIPVAFHRFGTGITMTVVAILIVFFMICGLGIKNTPEEAGEYPDGDSENAEDIAAVVEEMRAYKSPFTLGKIVRTPAAWAIAVSMGLCFMVAMTYIASIVPRMLSVGYQYPQATTMLIACGVAAMIGSYVIGLIDQKVGTKKADIMFCCLIMVGIILGLFHAKSLAICWVASIIFSASNGGCGNLIPSSIATVFGRWDYASAYNFIGPITSLCAGLGVILSSVFPTYDMLYKFDIVLLVIALIIMIFTKYKMIGKKG